MSTDRSEEVEASDVGQGSEDRARVPIRPPLLLLGCIVVGSVLHPLIPLGFLPGALAGSIGFGLVAAAIALFVWAVREMTGAGEELPTHSPTREIVRSGPYAFTRNPIYLSFCLLQLGIAVWVNAITLLASLAFCFWVLNEAVIPREEEYLERKFGSTYRDYCAEVSRWL